MEEKKYLKWYNKVGYGSGDIAGNVVFAFLSSFIMIYLTNTVGLNAGVIGSLIAVSKVLDGISDVIFGSMIDKTHTKMGKARPWMLGAYFGCAITLIAAFSVPTTMGRTSQYIWFFITYLLLNAGFYTANNIAYSTLTALITKNGKERVQMGSIRFMFAFGTSFIIQTITVDLVQKLGGGAAGWRTIAIIYAIIGLISNTITVFSVKELPEEELRDGNTEKAEEKYSLIGSIKMLIHNKYYLVILVVDILRQTYSAIINMGIFYMTYVLGKAELLGTFSGAINLALIVGLAFLPSLVAKFKGYYKLNFSSRCRTWNRHCCRLYGQCTVDVSWYCNRCNWYGSMAGQLKCVSCRMFRAYIPSVWKANRRNYVLMYIHGTENRQRTWNSNCRLASVDSTENWQFSHSLASICFTLCTCGSQC